MIWRRNLYAWAFLIVRCFVHWVLAVQSEFKGQKCLRTLSSHLADAPLVGVMSVSREWNAARTECTLDYEHIPVTAKLDLGLRNLEIDVYPDEKGGKYANPKGLEMVPGQQPYDPQGKMKQPGFKLLHVPDFDFRSHYFTLTDCLRDLRSWSEAHPDHTPVYITLEVKGKSGNMSAGPTRKKQTKTGRNRNRMFLSLSSVRNLSMSFFEMR